MADMRKGKKPTTPTNPSTSGTANANGATEPIGAVDIGATDAVDTTVEADKTADESVAVVEETTAAETAETSESTKGSDADNTKTNDMEAVLSDIQAISGDADTSGTVQVRKNTFNLTDKIPCKSLFHGKLVYTSPLNGSRWVWNEYGAIQHVPVSELETMNNHKPDILNKPLLLILEPTIADDFNFGDVYRKVASFNKLDAILATGKVDLVRSKVKALIEVGMRDSVIADMRKRRKENTLVDINIINMLRPN